MAKGRDLELEILDLKAEIRELKEESRDARAKARRAEGDASRDRQRAYEAEANERIWLNILKKLGAHEY